MAVFESSVVASDWFKIIIVLDKNLSEYHRITLLIGEIFALQIPLSKGKLKIINK
jgi:RNA polymerase subunit RPABC4/transcription elongation factor Spt4